MSEKRRAVIAEFKITLKAEGKFLKSRQLRIGFIRVRANSAAALLFENSAYNIADGVNSFDNLYQKPFI